MTKLMTGCFTLLTAFLISAASPSVAQVREQTPQQFEQKLKEFDSASVSAAQSYMRTFNMKGQFEQTIPLLRDNLARQLKGANPSLSEQNIKDFVETMLKVAFVDNGPVLENVIMVLVLETFTKGELVALDRFYASPEGRSILSKMPQMLGRMPDLMQLLQRYIIPDALRAAQENLRKQGVEVRI